MSAHNLFRITPFKAKAGLKKGCNPSLLLANIFLSDLHQALEKEHVCAPQLNKHRVTSVSWSDDFLIMSLSASGLQKCIENLEQFAKQLVPVVSMKKTGCVIFSKTSCKYLKEAPFVYDNEPIPFETFYKYLGVEISNKCELDIVKKERTVKARNATFASSRHLQLLVTYLCH